MRDDECDLFAACASVIGDEALKARLLAGLPEGLVPLYCPFCERRFGVPRDPSRRFPDSLAIVVCACEDCAPAEGDIPQLWFDRRWGALAEAPRPN